jgi:hypothetical protein
MSGDDKRASRPTLLPESGVLPQGSVGADGVAGVPPFSVVLAYLARGEHAAWVEAHAARSRAFSDVLAAMRNDHDERAAERRPKRAARPRG